MRSSLLLLLLLLLLTIVRPSATYTCFLHPSLPPLQGGGVHSFWLLLILRDLSPNSHPPSLPPSLLSLPPSGYPRHSGIARPDQIFTAQDHHNLTLAAQKHGENFELIAKEVGRPQWAIVAFNAWQHHIAGVWHTYHIVEDGRERRLSEAEILRALGENFQMVYDGTW